MPLSFLTCSPFKSPKSKIEPVTTTEPKPRLESILINPTLNLQMQPQPWKNDETRSSSEPPSPVFGTEPPPTESTTPVIYPTPEKIKIHTPLHPKYKWYAESFTLPLPSKPLNHIQPLGKADPDKRKGLQGHDVKCRFCKHSIRFWVSKEWEARARGKMHEKECAANLERELRRSSMGGSSNCASDGLY